jgi:hypothetical protein
VTIRPLLPPLLTATLLLTALNLMIGAWSHRLPYYKKLEAIRTAQDPNLLFVGNSLLDGHLDEDALVQAARCAHFRPLNTALGASQAPEQQLLFDYAVQNHSGVRTLVLGIFDFQLTAQEHSRLTDLIGNRMVGIDRRFPVSEVIAVYGFDRLDRLELQVMRRLPMAANRANAWKYVELLRRSMGAMGMPHAATNSMGRVDDFAALESGSVEIFDAQARTFLEHPDHFNSSYESILGRAHDAGMNVVIVAMPMSPSHCDIFYARPLWRQYRMALTALAGQRGVKVIDASNWMHSERDFDDHLHMTQEAAHDFSVRLGSELTRTACHY